MGSGGDTGGIEADLRSLLIDMRSSLHTIDSKIDTLTNRLDFMGDKLDEHEDRLGKLEQRTSDAEDGAAACYAQIDCMEQALESLRAKNEDLESRSLRNNIRILGLPESTNMEENFTLHGGPASHFLRQPPH
mgnify:CR=1 FL=1